jgi:hypothetical protein
MLAVLWSYNIMLFLVTVYGKTRVSGGKSLMEEI